MTPTGRLSQKPGHFLGLLSAWSLDPLGSNPEFPFHISLLLLPKMYLLLQPPGLLHGSQTSPWLPAHSHTTAWALPSWPGTPILQSHPSSANQNGTVSSLAGPQPWPQGGTHMTEHWAKDR